MDVRAGGEDDVAAREPGQFRDPQPGLDREHEQGVVASPGPGAPLAGGDERVDLRFGEVGDEVALEPLGRDGEDALDRGRMLGVAQCGIAEQGVDRREPVVAGADAVVPVRFEVLQERAHERGVEIADVEGDGLLAGPRDGEAEEEPEGVAIGGDGVRAGSTLAHQPLGEERLQGGREGAHGRPPNRPSRRAAASSISSGAADRYQYVPAGLTWPRYVESAAIWAPTSAPERCQPMSVWTAQLWRRSCRRGRTVAERRPSAVVIWL